jgi:hypothetical protein
MVKMRFTSENEMIMWTSTETQYMVQSQSSSKYHKVFDYSFKSKISQQYS